MNAFDFVLFTIKSFFLSHALPLVAVIAIVLLILSVIFLGTGPAVVAFLRSRTGQIIIALGVAGAVGWELKGYVDDAVALQRQLVDERAKAKTALAIAEAKTRDAEARAAAARREAEDARAIATAANQAEAKARAEANDIQEQVNDFSDALAGAGNDGFALSGADVRRLRAIGATPRRKRA